MKKITFLAIIMLFAASVIAQSLDFVPDYDQAGPSLKSTSATGWVLQFSSFISTASWKKNTAGIESDGTNIFIAKVTSNKFYKLTIAGALLDSFALTGTPAFPFNNGIRDLAYDGQYFYGCCNNNIIYKMNFTTKAIVGTITLPSGIQGRHISYDPTADGGLGGFWVGGWSDDIVLYSRTGATLNTIPASGLGSFSANGSAYDSLSPGGPYLWLYSQTGANMNTLIKVNIATKSLAGIAYDIVPNVLGASTTIGAGGCFITKNLISGTTTIGGLITGVAFWGYDLATTLTPPFGFSVSNLTLASYALVNTQMTMLGVLFNYGATTITSFDLNYKVNSNPTVTQNITGVNIPAYANYNYSHSTIWTTPASPGTFTVKLWASNVNGNNAWNSDTITRVVTTATSIAWKKVVLEEFTGIYSQYCPDGHRVANDYKALHPNDVFLINIHQGSYAVPTGTDPDFRTAFGDALAAQTGLAEYPVATINRHVFPSGNSTALSSADWSSNGNQLLTTLTYANMTVSASVNYTTRILTVNTTVNYVANGAALNMMNVALVQNNIQGPQTGGATYNPSQVLPNGKYNHQHMLRHLLTGQWGDSITVTTAGTVRSKTYTYTLPASISNINLDMYNIEVIAFITEGKQEIVTAGGFKLPVAVNEVNNTIDLSFYPNPAKDNVQLSFNLSKKENVSINIYNSIGGLVFTQNKGELQSGNHTSNLNVNTLASGIYFVNVKAGEIIISKKLVIE
ncbi:MAG: Omp28-related outer membrane protein [Bacteroidetes bacterium]|nr:Omp28-related outer membrane protein [Bacteroidota bacterium]